MIFTAAEELLSLLLFMYNNLMIPCWSFSVRKLKEQYNIWYACLKKVGPSCWQMCCTWFLIRWCAHVVRSLRSRCNCRCRRSRWRCWATFDATKATDWTAALMLLVEVHIVVTSTAAEQGRWEGKLDVVYSYEVRFKLVSGNKDSSHESKPWKIPTSKLQFF